MYCMECGNELAVSAKFCRHCGALSPVVSQLVAADASGALLAPSTADAGSFAALPAAPGRPEVASPLGMARAPARPAAGIESPPPLPLGSATSFTLPPPPAAGVPTADGTMKVDWQNWDGGGRIIFVAACVAAASMLLNWVAFGVLSGTGLSQGAFLLWGCYLYPLLRLLKNQSIHSGWGVGCSAFAVVLTLCYIGSKQVTLFGKSVNGAAGGAYLFLLASIALGIGVVRYASARRARGQD